MEIRNLTCRRAEGEHFFFGYYDLQPYDRGMTRHLCHKVPFMDHHPTAAEPAEIGYIEVETGVYHRIAETCAWNFQQGAFLQWFEDGESVIFNDFDGEGYVSRIVTLDGREARRYGSPFAALHRGTGTALSINFSRIFNFRKGYGYSNIVDPFIDQKAPAEDGIFTVDLATGERRLLLSYADLREMFLEPPFTDAKLVVNHITFDPTGQRFVFLLRNFPEPGSKWGTVLAVSDMAGNVTKLTNFEVNSHYSWRDDRTLMIYSGLPVWGVYFIDTRTGERRMLRDPRCDKNDIHCNYAPDRRTFIGDGYPEADAKRALYRYDFATAISEELLRVASVAPADIDIRCDLHARWSPDGTRITYDTTENGVREIMEILL